MTPAYTIVKLALLTVIGLGVNCPHFDASGIGPTWQKFGGRAGELPAGRVWGVSLPAKDGFYYVAGQEVPEGTKVPEGMETAVIPAGNYFCVYFDDGPEKLPETWTKIFDDLIPAAGLKVATPPVAIEEYAPGWQDEEHHKFHLKLYVQLAPDSGADANQPQADAAQTSTCSH